MFALEGARLDAPLNSAVPEGDFREIRGTLAPAGRWEPKPSSIAWRTWLAVSSNRRNPARNRNTEGNELCV